MDRVDILPDGDIILAVSGSLELRVSSVVLSMTSPVFKTMLGPHFAENQALRTRVPYAMALPDDEASLMKALCLVSHHKLKEVQLPDVVGGDFIIGMVALADKYDCLDMLKLPATQWAVAVDFGLLAQPTQMSCADAAFTLDDAHFFERCTRAIIIGGIDGPLCASPDLGGREYTMMGALLETELHIFGHLKDSIDSIVETLGSALDPRFGHNHSESRWATTELCEFSKVAVGTLLGALSAACLWPSSYRSECLGVLFRSIEALKTPQITYAPCSDCCGNLTDFFERKVRELQEVARNLFTAVCLDCLKKESTMFSHCRVAHHGQWAKGGCGAEHRLHYSEAGEY
ncbi:hypothetical protein LTS10_007517 [Elasticomyces elasticus]|nr:hypothetical protein LTS10_007517 [Elasticomyces elasticus]